MKTISTILLAWVVTLVSPITFPLSGNTIAQEMDKKAAMKIFEKYKCMECHTVTIVGIGENAATSEAENEEDEEEGEAIEPPDLSEVGDKYDAKWISGYLRKKNSIEGRKHKKRFKGKKEERQVLSLWLESLKSDSTKTDSKKSNVKVGVYYDRLFGNSVSNWIGTYRYLPHFETEGKKQGVEAARFHLFCCLPGVIQLWSSEPGYEFNEAG